MSASNTKLLIGVILFFTWIGLVFAKSYDAQLDTADLISTIKLAIAGLGVYHMMDTPAASIDQPVVLGQPVVQPIEKAAP